ncbi:receptor-like protein kinase FERONIA isoform X1 [Argentina anserina]|uniref:receptor-like protein kinase FERONIA isoform X1 n=1 Tax=Argentina anserina TaxID=57926 RepID=UPI00217638C9|nr:receptor-like protein kinase FERONIA isoform X1 [Potentilla anserina]
MKTILPPPNLSRLFLFLGTLLTTGDSTTIYTPTFQINLNCGSSNDTVDQYDFRNWTGDINSEFFTKEVGSTSQVAEAPRLPSTGSDVPYMTARLSYTEFTYRFTVSPGQMFIRLYFFPASYNENFDISKSLFSVKAGGYRLLKDFNASLSSTDDDGEETRIREYCVNFEPEQNSLYITFTPSNGAYAFINGIEIMSMPTNFYYSRSAAEGDGASFIGRATNYYIENNTALEMIYRINVGGGPVSPNEDTGMYRTWKPTDESYLDGIRRSLSYPQDNIPLNFPTDIPLNFAKIRNYTAPEKVYRTGRTMGRNSTIIKSYNLTWQFPVDPEFSYLLRLHFCEIDPNITAAGERMFQIIIANLTAELHADVIGWTTKNGEGNGIPIYKDYFVHRQIFETQKKGCTYLFVALQSNKDDYDFHYNDAILNGLEIFKLNNTDGNFGAPMTTCIQDLPRDIQPSSNNSMKKQTRMLAILAGAVSVLLVLSIVGFLIFRRKRKVHDRRIKFKTTPPSSYPCHYFLLAEIKAATKNFSDAFIIGAGGFGNVYKGCIGGVTPVAIKRLKPESSQGAHEFETEIAMLSQLRHRHLVSLIGYCSDKGEMILVYDYMAHGTLRDHLYNTINPPLAWEQRLKICIGAARGLQYLHNGANGTIIHRDVKSTNILLDDKWVAKVSDFGLSKGTTSMSKTHISTNVKGSFGYVDPEYYRRHRLTEKSDVYSFGVVLCEVLCARPAIINAEELKQACLADWTRSYHQNGELDQIIDPSLRGKIAADCLNRFIETAISCMQETGTERPSMTDVVNRLERALQLQQSAEGNSNSTERNAEIETSSSEQSCAINDSIKCISATIFSEVNTPCGR